jgi:hypothetical protein
MESKEEDEEGLLEVFDELPLMEAKGDMEAGGGVWSVSCLRHLIP